MCFYIKVLQLIDGYIYSSSLRVFAHVADDVGQLQRLPQGVGINRGLGVGLPEYQGSHFAHYTSYQMAVALQVREVQVARLFQVHLATTDHAVQVLLGNAIGGRQGHQGLHDRVRGLAAIGLGDFAQPPG